MFTLLTPLRYLTIRHRAKLLYDVLLPLALATGVTWLLLGWSKPTPVFGNDGFVAQLQTLLTILGGFFIAALTLVTTDRNPILQEPVGGIAPPRLPGEQAPLNRRRFLAYLFGYLAFSAFVLVAAGVMANLIAPQAGPELAPAVKPYLKGAFVLVFSFWLAHVFVATLLGLFYFTERFQLPDPKLRARNPDAPPRPAE